MQLPLARLPRLRRHPRCRAELVRRPRTPSGRPRAPWPPPPPRAALGPRRPLPPPLAPAPAAAAPMLPQPPAGPRASGGPPGRGRACGRAGLPSRSERCSAEAARPPPRAGPSAPSPPARPPLPGEEEGEWSSRRRHRCRHGARPRGGRDQPPGRIRPSASPPPPPPLPSLPPRLEPPHAKRQRESAGRPERMPPPEPGAAPVVAAGRRSAERWRHRHGPPVPGSASRACPGAELVGVPALHSGSHGLPPSRVAGWRSRRCVVTTGGRRWLRGSRKVVPPQVPRTKVLAMSTPSPPPGKIARERPVCCVHR